MAEREPKWRIVSKNTSVLLYILCRHHQFGVENNAISNNKYWYNSQVQKLVLSITSVIYKIL